MCMHMREHVCQMIFVVLGAEPRCKPNCSLVKKASYVHASNKLRQVGGTSCTGTSIAFHLTAAPKCLKHVETNNSAAIAGKFCAGDAECKTHKSLYNKTQRNVLLCNSRLSAG